MLILGLSPFRHDSSAVLLEDGKLKAAVENDKLTRSRSDGPPEAAIRFCLEGAQISLRDIEVIVIASRRPSRRSLPRLLFRARQSPMSSVTSVHRDAGQRGKVVSESIDFRQLQQMTGASSVRSFDHHFCHAAAAFFQSPFDRALVITLDEGSEGTSGMLAIGEGTRLRVLERIAFPHSPAWVYKQVTNLIGFRSERDEHKTQWLSVEGEPTYKDAFIEMLRRPGSPLPHLDDRFFKDGLGNELGLSCEFYRRIGLSKGCQQLSQDLRRALACSIQGACTQLVSELVAHSCKKVGVDRVCLAGGLFQNSLLVTSLEDDFGIDHIFVPPAPGNASSAVGAALVVWHHLMQKPRLESFSSAYLGPRFSHHEIKDTLDNCKLRYSLQNTEQRKIDATLQLLESGKVVGWYQGAAEFGPRALGNRSVLASPWAQYVIENLNDYIKHRESFRPFAIAVPEDDCARFFVASRLCHFMTSLARVRSDRNPLPPGLCLPGGRVRLQIVERCTNPLFWELLKQCGERTSMPMLLNTSFNLFGEPLVVSPRDALRSYFSSGIDALVIDNFVLSKAVHLHPTIGATAGRRKGMGTLVGTAADPRHPSAAINNV
jgi:carbamoyltransferase